MPNSTYTDPFFIGTQSIAPGETGEAKIKVGSLSPGTRIYIKAFIYRSINPGPTVMVLGGVHGDEINGVEIVRRSMAEGLFQNLKAGSVISIPLLNVYGFINFSRDVPDGKDVNRSFPGSMSGSLASRVARSLTKKILPYIDFGVDFHTGGRSHYNYPQIRFSKGNKKSEELAEVFDAPFSIANAPIPKSLRKVALEADKPIIVFEGGENLRLDGFSIKKGMDGLKRLLHAHGMTKTEPPKSDGSTLLSKTSWMRAPKAGLFEWTKQSGHKVEFGEPLGYLRDPYGQGDLAILAKKNGYIIGHNNSPVVNAGDALFNIGLK